jgi:hypothetical protein
LPKDLEDFKTAVEKASTGLLASAGNEVKVSEDKFLDGRHKDEIK